MAFRACSPRASLHADCIRVRLAVLPVAAARWNAVRSIEDLGSRVRDELAQFFEAAVEFEGKDLKILGWGGPEEAMALVRESERAPGRARARASAGRRYYSQRRTRAV